MFDCTVTIFNYHKATDTWYMSVVSSADIGEATQKGQVRDAGATNSSAVTLLLPCSSDKSITTTDGTREYATPKTYAECDVPAECFTLSPECDFIYSGDATELSDFSDADLTEGIADTDYEEGFYRAMNDAYDGVYMINSAEFYSLIPHFEIGGA